MLRAAWVLPICAPPIRDGYVAVEGERIVAVGRWADIAADGRGGVAADAPVGRMREAASAVNDLGGAILMPGFVNPHTHLELTCYANQLPPGPFWPWLAALVQLRAQPGQIERETQGVIDGAWQSLRAGVTCVGDISRRNLHWRPLKQIPLRKVCFVELLSLADHPPRNVAELRAEFDEVEEDSLLTAAITPHAPYSVPADQIRGAIRLAHERRRPWCTHWAETPEEVAFLGGDMEAFPPFLRAVLEQCGVTAPGRPALEFLAECVGDCQPGALAHLNYLTDADIARLATAGHVAMYCPRAHCFFGHRPHPLPRLIAAGVPVALGTDSLASNFSLAPLEELRCVHETVSSPPPAAELLRMITLTAARALSLESVIGTLAPGKQADLVAFPCRAGERDPERALVTSAPAPLQVWVAGRAVW
jgi:aminodeoxyfutalosine deaminase